MIEYIKGQLQELTPTYAVVDCQGVGYFLNISLVSYEDLRSQPTGSPVKLLAEEIIREDSHQLYGFATQRERALFRHLTGVSGVGPNTARMILSAYRPADIEGIIAGGDYTRLKSVKGIGAKTAQRIIVDLRDKIKPADDTLLNQSETTSDTFEEAMLALVMLGFAKPQSQKVLKKIFDADPTIKVEAAIKKALAMM